MNNNLKLGYGVSLPIDYNKDIPEYSIENINLIKSWSKKFNCIQIMFSKTKLDKKQLKEIKSIVKDYKYIFVHASYKINIGADLLPSKSDLYNTGFDILINEINWALKIGAKGIILHMGKNVKKKFDPDHVYNNMIKFIIEFFKKLKLLSAQTQTQTNNIIKLPILLETPAGQGGEMCWDLNEFVDFILKFKNLPFYPQLGVCVDTCHIFQAGHDINNIKEIKKIHNILGQIQDKIKLIHLNDSYHSVGQHIDRHEQIGQGQIQIDKLIQFIYPYYKIKIPMVLETIGPYDKQLELLDNI